jgi:hypothetical protein
MEVNRDPASLELARQPGKPIGVSPSKSAASCCRRDCNLPSIGK